MWNEIKVLTDSEKLVSKYVFTSDEVAVESILYKYPTYEDRTVICCSTQSGCPIGCRFCGSGDYFVRSLTADEIVSQPVKLIEDTQVNANDMKRLQIMFMSMGEPLLNLKNLIPALHQLYAKYPKAALLISTSAPKVDLTPLLKVSQEIPTIGLQFSVHESTDENRNKLIPFANKMTLQEIARAGDEFFVACGRTPFFNYCVHAKNGSEEDADRLSALFDCRHWQATISVICERDETLAGANARQRQLAEDFSDKLASRSYQTRVFDPAGQDSVGGGCGQLFHFQNWMKNHQEKVRKSIGYNLPIVHMPRMELELV